MKGLPNVGNTCYFNSALQCLFQVPPLSNYFLKIEGRPGDTPFVQEYRRLIRMYWSDNKNVVDPSQLLQCVQERFKQFRGRDQQDAQEVLMCMLEMFDQTLVKQVFMGQTVQETMCASGKSHVTQDFYSIVVYVEKPCTMQEALDKYHEYSTIEEYVDAKGVTHNYSVSRTLFHQVPRIFIMSFQNRHPIKVSHKLRLSPGVDKTLFALIVHQGSQNGGHYTSYTNHCGTWYYKDDLQVTATDPPEVDHYYLALYK